MQFNRERLFDRFQIALRAKIGAMSGVHPHGYNPTVGMKEKARQVGDLP
jgi:hypothetical protein